VAAGQGPGLPAALAADPRLPGGDRGEPLKEAGEEVVDLRLRQLHAGAGQYLAANAGGIEAVDDGVVKRLADLALRRGHHRLSEQLLRGERVQVFTGGEGGGSLPAVRERVHHVPGSGKGQAGGSATPALTALDLLGRSRQRVSYPGIGPPPASESGRRPRGPTRR
jgi:hypothetical protein